jgi:hypothetical protein
MAGLPKLEERGMSSRTAFLSKLIGLSAITIAIALVVNKQMMR